MKEAPCPFCGERKEVYIQHWLDQVTGEFWAGHCFECAAFGPRGATETKARAAWRRRATAQKKDTSAALCINTDAQGKPRD